MITVNLTKAKTIAHGIRREMRELEFAPLDAVIMKQIPGKDLQQAEQQRQVIRDKYAVMQTRIDEAASPEELKSVLGV